VSSVTSVKYNAKLDHAVFLLKTVLSKTHHFRLQ
jgi:hypothetical protein